MSVVLFSDVGFLGIMVVFSSLVGLFLERGHLLMVLLFFETVMLGLFLFLVVSMDVLGFDSYLCLVLVSFAACEAAVGLSLLVSLIRSHGNDFVSILSLYEC
uniref:NADH-ubiquinone oxidoreductase chain 4L n=1 Tax=Micrura ignea TaxID=328822 RepID=A0A0D5NSZ3_9BILA|nr:NADH dehydrogenase subunit 4L [Micrura ignea]AJY78582.1 NADH dehydrogenase subunit 4L [Micrura ignea]